MAAKSKSGKSYGKKKGKKPKSKAVLTRGIGVLSTIKVPTALRNAFKAGLNDPNVTIKVRPALSYRRNKMERIIREFNADPEIGLIITVGGLIAYDAADDLATKPFISLSGVEPTSPGQWCF